MYNNGYQESSKMIPFEILYGRKFKAQISWDSPMEQIMLRPELLKDMEWAMVNIRQHLKVSQERQKIYIDRKITHKEFKVGDHVYL
jgi:hypothetical protein